MINDRYKTQLLYFRREYNNKRNLNYHLDKDNLDETLKWFNWNKMIHLRGVRENAVIIFMILRCLFHNVSILLCIVSFLLSLIF